MGDKHTEWERWAKNYDDDLKTWMSINDSEVLREFDFTGKDVLDVGAGTGRFSCRIASIAKTITIIEPCEAMINIAKERLRGQKNLNFSRSTLESFNPDKSYDMIIISELLHHLDIQNQAQFDKLFNSLRKDGLLIVLEPIKVNLIRFIWKLAIKNFCSFGISKGSKMLTEMLNPRVIKHVSCDRYLTKDQIHGLFINNNLRTRKHINDNFYLISMVKG